MSPAAQSNTFAWSFSRNETFLACHRRYYYAYYGAWGGWLPSAPARARELYILKRLSTRPQWAGQHVHHALKHLIETCRSPLFAHVPETHAPPRSATHEDDPLFPPIRDAEIEAMREEFRLSRIHAYRNDPVHHTGLYEHEYGLEIPQEEWQATRDRVTDAIRGFLTSDVWAELRGLADEDILALEPRMASFTLDGLRVIAIPDLIIRLPGGRMRIFDWKSSGTHESLARHRLQLGIYALYAGAALGAAPEQIEAVAFNPATGARATFHYSGEDLADLREVIHDSADEMLYPLEGDPHNAAPEEDNFACTEENAPCAFCPFFRVCPKHAATG